MNKEESVLAHEKLDVIISEVERKCRETRKFYNISYPKFESVEKNLFDTPHGYWDKPGPLPPKHSDRLHHKIVDMLSKSNLVNIVTMGLPRDNLNAAIKWGVSKALDDKTKTIVVGILCGSVYNETVDTKGYINRFITDLKTWNPDVNRLRRLKLFVASHDYEKGRGWNHGKLLVSDFEEIMFGGHNLWGNDYMEDNPIFDLSLVLKGDIAIDGNNYANELWRFVYKNNRSQLGWKTYSNSFRVSDSGHITITNDTAPVFNKVRSDPQDKSIKALYLAQPGLGLVDHNATLNPIFVAMNFAFRIAKERINIIQQDIGSGKIINGKETGKTYIIRGGFRCIQFIDRYGTETCHGFYYDVLDSLAHALKSKLKPTLNIVLTNNGQKSYSNGLTWRAVYRALAFMLHKVYQLSREETINILTNQVHIRHIAFQGKHHWGNDPKAIIGIHSKYWEVDGEVTSIGSFNLYPSILYTSYELGTVYLNEFSVIVSGDKIVNTLKTEYFDKVWNSSISYVFDPVLLNNLPDFQGLDSIDEEMQKQFL